MTKAAPKCFEQIQKVAATRRLTQKDLMDAGQISRTAANHYYHGEHEPRFSVLQQWGIIFGLNMNWFFYGEGAMFRTPKAAPCGDEAEAVRSQAAHLRLVHDSYNRGDNQLQDSRETKEVVIKGQDKDALEAQIKLIDHVCKSLADHGASQEMIQRAILALVSGAF